MYNVLIVKCRPGSRILGWGTSKFVEIVAYQDARYIALRSMHIDTLINAHRTLFTVKF